MIMEFLSLIVVLFILIYYVVIFVSYLGMDKDIDLGVRSKKDFFISFLPFGVAFIILKRKFNDLE